MPNLPNRPDPDWPRDPDPLLTVRGLVKHFDVSGGFLDQLTWRDGKVRRQRQFVHAVNGIDLTIQKAEALCLVGESGCGKTTVGRVIMGLLSPSAGAVHYQQQRIDTLTRKALLPYRKKMQMIFQNPYASLNPRKTIATTLLEPARLHFPQLTRAEHADKVAQVMQAVGVDASWGARRPHEFSGGQRQRISIARALMVDPEFIVADEPVSALDVSIQAQVLNVLMQAQQARALTYLFITHDLAVVEHFATRVAVMYLGRICEVGPTATLFAHPHHPYTRALLSARPTITTRRTTPIKLPGEVPTPLTRPRGCVFHSRCQQARARCLHETPPLHLTAQGNQVACHGVAENWLQ